MNIGCLEPGPASVDNFVWAPVDSFALESALEPADMIVEASGNTLEHWEKWGTLGNIGEHWEYWGTQMSKQENYNISCSKNVLIELNKTKGEVQFLTKRIAF